MFLTRFSFFTELEPCTKLPTMNWQKKDPVYG